MVYVILWLSLRPIIILWIALPGGLSSLPTKWTDFNPLNLSAIEPPFDCIELDFNGNFGLGAGAIFTFSTSGKGVGKELIEEDDTRWWIPSCLKWYEIASSIDYE